MPFCTSFAVITPMMALLSYWLNWIEAKFCFTLWLEPLSTGNTASSNLSSSSTLSFTPCWRSSWQFLRWPASQSQNWSLEHLSGQWGMNVMDSRFLWWPIHPFQIPPPSLQRLVNHGAISLTKSLVISQCLRISAPPTELFALMPWSQLLPPPHPLFYPTLMYLPTALSSSAGSLLLLPSFSSTLRLLRCLSVD